METSTCVVQTTPLTELERGHQRALASQCEVELHAWLIGLLKSPAAAAPQPPQPF